MRQQRKFGITCRGYILDKKFQNNIKLEIDTHSLLQKNGMNQRHDIPILLIMRSKQLMQILMDLRCEFEGLRASNELVQNYTHKRQPSCKIYFDY